MLNRIRHIDGLSAVDPMGGIHLPVTIDRGAVSEGVDDEDVAVALLEEHHLATHPGYLYGLDDSLTLVLSFLAPADRITDGLARLERYLRFARS